MGYVVLGRDMIRGGEFEGIKPTSIVTQIACMQIALSKSYSPHNNAAGDKLKTHDIERRLHLPKRENKGRALREHWVSN